MVKRKYLHLGSLSGEIGAALCLVGDENSPNRMPPFGYEIEAVAGNVMDAHFRVQIYLLKSSESSMCPHWYLPMN